MRWAAFAAAVIGLGWTATGQTCNVEDKADAIFSLESFSDDIVEVYPVPARVLESGSVRLTEFVEKGGSNGQMFLKEKQRLADGFIATFKFSMKGSGDGIAFLVQNWKTENSYFQFRNTLGFVNAIQNYLAVALLACPDGVTCAEQKAVLWTKLPDGAPVAVNEAVLPANVNLTSGDIHTGVFIYKADVGEAEVKINGVSVVTGNVGSLLDIFGGEIRGWMGFSSSTYEGGDFFLTSDTDVHSLALSVQPVFTAVSTELGKTVDWGVSAFFNVVNRDTCQKVIPFADPTANNITAVLRYAGEVGSTNYTLDREPVVDRDFFLPQIDYSESEGFFALRFDLPRFVAGKWTLEVSVNGVKAEGSPFESAIITKQPDPPEGIPAWGLALLIVLIVLIVLGLIYAIYRLRRYRKKLQENKDDIEAGKEKHYLDGLERDVSFQMNPMLGTLEEMKEKLRENERELERLRNGKAEQYDDDHTISELQRQNAELRDEMNKLKKEAQQSEAMNSEFRPKLGLNNAVKRKEFEQSRA